MTQLIDRRRFLFASAACIPAFYAGGALADAPETSLRPVARGESLLKKAQRTPEELLEKAKLGGVVDYAVLDARDGTPLEQSEDTIALPPASVAKALTAAYALETLGPDFAFYTRLVAVGTVTDGVLQGDLVLAGSGDPTLDTNGLARLAQMAWDGGLRQVTGEFLVWGGALPNVTEIDSLQPDHVGYNPSISGLNLNYNRVHFEWRRASGSYDISMEARTETYRPAVDVSRMAVIDRSLPVYTYEDRAGRDHWTVAKGALGDGGARWLPVRKPEIYAGEVFRSVARGVGLSLSAPKQTDIAPKGQDLASLQSPKLTVILRNMLKYSTNLTAETVGLAASLKRASQAPETLAGSAAMLNGWLEAELGVSGVALVDHSGLGDQSRVSASQMAQALRALRSRVELKPLLKPFRMLDEQRNIIPDHPLSVAAKTGTLNFVSGLAGFVDLPDGRELVFAIFAADLERRASLTEAEREKPEGGRSWNRRAKILQQALIERWGVVYALDAEPTQSQ